MNLYSFLVLLGLSGRALAKLGGMLLRKSTETKLLPGGFSALQKTRS
jgi:hypothetical protein